MPVSDRSAEHLTERPDARLLRGGVCCPACLGPLETDLGEATLSCPRCEVVYPLIDSLPLLVRAPSAYLYGSIASIAATRREMAATLSELDRIGRAEGLSFRRDLMGRASEGIRLNMRLVAMQEDALRRRTRPVLRVAHRVDTLRTRALSTLARVAGRAASTAPPTGYDFDLALRYLRTDWGGTMDGERQISMVQAVVSKSVRDWCDTKASAVYLGAGLGRYLCEGAHLFGDVIGVELSYAAAGLVQALRVRPLEFASLQWEGAVSDDELVQRHRAELLPQPGFGANVAYIVADSLSLPIANASQDAVVSVFFTDVVPLSRLLPEVKRVLRPGGQFISVGPLHYHFKDRAERFTQQEVRQVIERVHEMDVQPGETFFELPFMEGPGSVRSSFRVWSFVATRRRGQ